MTPPEEIDLDQARRPGLARRLVAIFYDSLMVAGMILVPFTFVVVLPDEILGREAAQAFQRTPIMEALKTGLLVAIMLAFHLGFWTHGGQTVGMRAWRLRVIRWDGAPLRLRDALVRYLVAWVSALCLGLGFLWSLWDRDGYTWHDRASRTRLVMLRRDV